MDIRINTKKYKIETQKNSTQKRNSKRKQYKNEK